MTATVIAIDQFADLPDATEACDHDDEYIDDSFGHEFGTEVIQYMKCIHCGRDRDIEPGEFDYDDRDDLSDAIPIY